MSYYPVFLNLEGKKTVVVGGGKVAERKIFSLIRSGADITVVSPRLTKRLLTKKAERKIGHLARDYKTGDLAGAFLVIAATDSSEINKKVAWDAPALVNVVDTPSQCNFIVPSSVRRGDMIIAVSTSGAAPALSKAARKELERWYGPEFTEYLNFVKKIRARALTEITEKKTREDFLKSLASEKTLYILRTKGVNPVKSMILRGFGQLS